MRPLTDINGIELELGQKVCWLSRSGNYSDSQPKKVKIGTVQKLCMKLQKCYHRYENGKYIREDFVKTLTTIGIKEDGEYWGYITCYNPKRVGILGLGNPIDQETQVLIARLDDKEEA